MQPRFLSLSQQQKLMLLVTEVRLEAEDVISIVLRDPEGADLPDWSPGAHVELQLPSGLLRQYSLCGATTDVKRWTIAVLREPAGRGGSLELHDSPLVGRTIVVRALRNHFKMTPSQKYVFIAGGIGVTPILAMVRELGESVPWALHYGGRSSKSMAFMQELVDLGGGKVHLKPQDDAGLLDIDSILTSADENTAIYCCGPPALLAAVEIAHETLASASPFFIERFTAAEPTGPISEALDGHANTSFEIELRRSGVTAIVPSDRSTLDVIRDYVPDAQFSCEGGYCGSCEVAVLEGTPDHRDEILTEEERRESQTMFPCVSRAHGPLVIDA